MKEKTVILVLFLFLLSIANAQKFNLLSPDNKLKVEILIGNTVSYIVKHEQDTLVYPSSVALKLENKTLGHNPKIKRTEKSTFDTIIESPFYKRSSIRDNYNQLTFTFKDDYTLIFRLYDEGMAYRFITTGKTDFVVIDEEANFNLGYNSFAYIPYVRSDANTYEEQFFNSFENIYSYSGIKEWNKTKLAFSPIVVERVNGKKIAIAEADLFSYPGMFLYNPNQSLILKGKFANYPSKEEQHEHVVQSNVTERKNYIAECSAKTVFPWRIILVSQNDKDLADSDMVYRLATPSKVADVSWIKPGKVAWEWWNDSNLYGVDFKTGINNETYKHYIDFASKNHIEYVILDAGWSVYETNDLFDVVPEINLKELIRYADKKNVGLILWAGYNGFNKDIEKVCRHYSEMGIKGFKIDFMDRDDQIMVDFHVRAAKAAASYKLIIDFHGTYKPSGLQRTYPNVLNFEAVHGLEQLKFPTAADQVEYDVTLPFIRQIAGPVDYTQGAMRNAAKNNFRPVFAEPMSQGTRCRQLAAYIVFESPLNMLCDSPSNYEKEPECTGFITQIPTVWDNTVAIDGKIGEYVVIARQKGRDWYIGAFTNWDARTLDLDLSFLEDGAFTAEIFKDGINAGKVACDYKKEIIPITKNKTLTIKMAPGGGFAIKISKK
jgi:alpha-glucosidase